TNNRIIAVTAGELDEHCPVGGREFGRGENFRGAQIGFEEPFEERARLYPSSPFFPAMTRVASSATAQAGYSAAGSASARLPPSVPRLRIAGCAMCGAAWARSGACFLTSGDFSIWA